MAGNNKSADLKRLQQVVGAYGAEPARWPAADRAELAALALAHGDAAWMRAAVELDTMLDSGAAARGAIAPRQAILAAARATRQNPAGAVVSIGAIARHRRDLRNWSSAALLAASLLVGIWAGANGAVEYLLPSTVGDALMTLNASEDESNFFGLFDASAATAGEDVL